MALHVSTFDYLKPTDEQVAVMSEVRGLFKMFVMNLDDRLPDGPDKTYVLRVIRDAAMWANVSITRAADGSPLV